LLSHLQNYIESNSAKHDHRIFGVVTAVVTKNKDPDGMGRIKVKFPWISEAKDKESNWVRIATMMAGKEMGSYFIPEIDDEVLIAFEHGDINYPYMIGALWNGKDKAPETNDDDKNNIRTIKSRSGHKVIFDDKGGEEKFEVIDKTGKMRMTFKVKEKAVEIMNESDDGTLKIYSKGKMTIESDDDIEITSKKNIKMSAKEDFTLSANNIKAESKADTKIDAKGKVDIASKAPMQLDSKASLKITSSAPADIKSSASLKLEGAMVDLKASGMAKVKASGMLQLESGAIASLKGSITKLG